MAEITMAAITEEIASHLKKELDEPFKRMLAGKVDAWRSQLLRRTLRDNPKERQNFRQTLWVPMQITKEVPECIDPNAPACSVMESTLQMPDPVRANGIMYDFVGSVDGATSFKVLTPGTKWILSHGKYTKDTVYYEVMNNMLRIHTANGIPLVRVDGVFDKPDEVNAFNCESSATGCDSWNEPYPVTNDIKQLIVQSIIQIDYGQPVAPSNKEIQVTPQLQEHAPDGR